MEAEIVRMCCNLFNVSINSGMYSVLSTLNTYLLFFFSKYMYCLGFI